MSEKIRKILITGGPVHAYLDAVKIITNKFKGGRMVSLADQMFKMGMGDFIYLTSKGFETPSSRLKMVFNYGLENIYHDGIDDYMEKVKQLSKEVDIVILGAAVANLIPKNKINGKFPSHNFRPGDVIPVDFTIAPRVIDEVKKINPNVFLFGFKLLSGVDHEELIKAAYGVLLESKATTIFANDAKDLDTVYAVMKDRSVHKMDRDDIGRWIKDRVEEKYYKTVFKKEGSIVGFGKAYGKFLRLLIDNKNSFSQTPEGFIFGSVAVRINGNKFITTSRGKDEITGPEVIVREVNHIDRVVFVDDYINQGKNIKASLNAPLFSYIFEKEEIVSYILHFHTQMPYLETLDYATPGTDMDSIRDLRYRSFNIKGHGCILCYNNEGKLL